MVTENRSESRMSSGRKDELAGFLELLPQSVVLEQRLIKSIRQSFEHFGFSPLDTASVQPWDVMTAGGAQYSDGGIGKPTFEVIEPPESVTGGRFGLRYDLTVPLSRFIAEHFASLHFPLHCYQIGKVWRAEELTPGHWREFYQCDVDIIGDGRASLCYDAEIACLISSAFDSVGMAGFTVHISNRKVIAALLRTHGIVHDRVSEIVHIIDEGGRQPVEETIDQLLAARLPKPAVLDVAELIRCTTIAEARRLFTVRDTDETGLDELDIVLDAARAMGMPPGRLRLDFSITRGHDYYTGTVYETFVTGREEWGAMGSGGRYDDLLSHVSGTSYPGVGISIGLSRLGALLRSDDQLPGGDTAEHDVIAVGNTASILDAVRRLRSTGFNTRTLFDTNTGTDPVGLCRTYSAKAMVTTGNVDGRETLVVCGAHGSVATVSADDLTATVTRIVA
jgi:histidyl-tRNA synthetase